MLSFPFRGRGLALMVLSTCALLSVSCGKKADKDEDERLLEPLPEDESFADQYFVEDESCVAGEAGASEIGVTPVHLWNGDAIASVSQTFDGASSVVSLKGRGISGSYYNFKQS